MNLLGNAIKFTDRGSVTLQLDGTTDEKTDTTQLRICVSDTGIGISADKLSIVFDKFVQADATVTRRFGGSGLGLTITKALVERMNGTISAKSELGIGSTFIVTIPLNNTATPVTQEEIALIGTGDDPGEHLNILLVEDYEPNTLVADNHAGSNGIQFRCGSKPEWKPSTKFQRNSYDMILMDVQMPEMDGTGNDQNNSGTRIRKGVTPYTHCRNDCTCSGAR